MLKSLWENKAFKGKKDTTAILKENILFQDLSARDLRFVTNIVHHRHYRNSEIVFHQGEIGFGMYIIAEGSIEITATAGHPAASGKAEEVLVVRLHQDDFFGELALVEENARRNATARALTDTRLIGFFKPDLLEIIERRPATGVKILLRLGEVIGRRLVETTEKMTRLNEEIIGQKGGRLP